MKISLAVISTVAVITATAVASQAATVLVDFSSTTSTPGGLQGGNYWNTIGTTSTTSLLDASTGLDSGWDTTVSFGGGNVGFGGNGIDGDGAAAPFDQSFAIIDGIFSNRIIAAGTATITFTNLVPNASYDFSTYSDRVSGYENGLISTTVGTGPASVALLKDAVTDFSIVSDGSGSIAFTFVEGPSESDPIGNSALLNALSISGPVFAPEPSTLLLAAFGLVSLAMRRRRRR